MQIRVDNLHKRQREIEFCEPVDGFPALVASAEQGDALFRGDVCGKVTASLAGGLVRVEGRAAVSVVVSCGRCLNGLERRIDVPLYLCYQQLEGSARPDAMPEELELTLRDMELIPFHGDEIDPGTEIAQELIMALPQSVLCRDDCAGLCPVCGVDLNVAACTCEKPVFHEGLARLRDFKVDRK